MTGGRGVRTDRAYLDIETTFSGGISVVGIHIPGLPLIQMVGGTVTDLAIAEALAVVDTVVTFNGTSFDFPVIRKVTGLDLRDMVRHRDLLRECRRRGLRGGLKRVEILFGIPRICPVVDGFEAPRLWQRWESGGDEQALATLLDYNREDVVNLQVLEETLDALDPGTGGGPGPRERNRRRI